MPPRAASTWGVTAIVRYRADGRCEYWSIWGGHGQPGTRTGDPVQDHYSMIVDDRGQLYAATHEQAPGRDLPPPGATGATPMSASPAPGSWSPIPGATILWTDFLYPRRDAAAWRWIGSASCSLLHHPLNASPLRSGEPGDRDFGRIGAVNPGDLARLAHDRLYDGRLWAGSCA